MLQANTFCGNNYSIIAESKGGTFAFVCGSTCSTSFPLFAAGVLCSLQCMIFLFFLGITWHYMHKGSQRYLGFGVFGADFGTATDFAAGLLPETSSTSSAKGGFLSLNSNKTGLSPSETPWLSLRGSRYNGGKLARVCGSVWILLCMQQFHWVWRRKSASSVNTKQLNNVNYTPKKSLLTITSSPQACSLRLRTRWGRRLSLTTYCQEQIL